MTVDTTAENDIESHSVIASDITDPMDASRDSSAALVDAGPTEEHTPSVGGDINIPACPVGEVWNSCGTACPSTCENPNPLFCTYQCVADCFCQSGWYRDEITGECVETLDECEEDSTVCPEGEIWNECGSPCPLTCENPVSGACITLCVEGCFCPSGWYRDEATGDCVEDLSECGSVCDENTDCSDDEWCRLSCGDDPWAITLTPPSMECVPYAQDGEHCGGYTMACWLDICSPELSCVDTCAMMMDEPGTCMDLCDSDNDCDSDEWCRAVAMCEVDVDFGYESDAKSCVPLAQEGELCGEGEGNPWNEEMCDEGLTCTDSTQGICEVDESPCDDFYYSTCEGDDDCMDGYMCEAQDGCVASTCSCSPCTEPWCSGDTLLICTADCWIDGSICVPEPTCEPDDCGPMAGAPSYLCEDGTLGGNTGNCIPTDDGCAWEWNECDMCEQVVNCFVDPCDFATCPAYPEATCFSNYCGGCNADFYVDDELVDCSTDDATCTDYPTGYFGTCEMALGVGVQDGMCSYISGCGAGDLVFFDSIASCKDACCPTPWETTAPCEAYEDVICTDVLDDVSSCLLGTDCVCVNSCDDGGPLMCDMEVPSCDSDLIPAIQNGCYECVHANTCETLCTDVNQDGALNVSDIILAVQLVLNINTTELPCKPDQNGDEVVTVVDILMMVSLLLYGG